MIGMLAKIKRGIQRVASGPLLFYLAHPQAFRRGVVAGPFKGTALAKTTWNKPVYLFIGSYERELHWLWNDLKANNKTSVWVIGAAEGYYACGIAKKWGAKVTAYEASDESRKALKRNVRLNELQHIVQVLGTCERAELRARLSSGAPDLILCDIEGLEDDLFSEDLLTMLKSTALVIETHPPYRSQSIAKLLAKTHDVQLISTTKRNLSDYPYRDWIPEKIKLGWLDERRPFPTPWLVASPRR